MASCEPLLLRRDLVTDAFSMVEPPALPIEAPPITAFEPPPTVSVPVEAVMGGHRLTGELQGGRVPRRLVDILNSVDGAFLVVHAAQLDDPFKPTGAEPRHLETIQILRDAILFIMPRGGAQPSDPFEVVKKVAAEATVVVPGFEISGRIYLMPDADPATIPLIGTHHFIPVTDATVTAGNGRSEVWREPVVLVNMTRALLYGPNRS